MPRQRVVIGFLGTTLDVGKGPERWDRWRPTIGLCQQEDWPIHRLELIHQPKVVDLTRQVIQDIASVSPETTVRPWPVEITDPWDFEKVYAAIFDFARQYPFDIEKEDYFVHITTGTHVAQICLFLLTESRHFPARLVQTGPRRHDPAGEVRIIDLDLSKYDSLAARIQREAKDHVAGLKSGIPTRNKAFNALIEQIEHVAAHSRDPILLMGPTGAGKSQLARRIFELKKTRHQITGDFIDVNGATLRGDAAMSALFGHRKGAFTGAVSDRPGLLRAADKGLLFLDEIGELGLDEQAMLLRAVEEKRFLPVGADREVSSDFLLIAGTNRDLLDDVRQGRFREDLLARINLWTFHLPALKDRREDLEPNLDYELENFERRTSRAVRFNREARDAYLAFAMSPDAPWSGNFRDLSASITRMATLAPSGRITPEIVAAEVARLRRDWSRGVDSPASEGCPSGFDSLLASVDLFDRVQLEAVLRTCAASSSLSDAGRRLFAVSRTKKSSSNDADRLRKYLARFGLTWADVSAARNPSKAGEGA
ncbi:MAG: RNA repair transcriptional activator RtcR [Phycisphaeraceae bacterium]|nr:RNA repair transcriptional activator RtcR [Phycisphaeraceae bacterium]